MSNIMVWLPAHDHILAYYYVCISGSPDRSTRLGSYTWCLFYICISFSIFVILVVVFSFFGVVFKYFIFYFS